MAHKISLIRGDGIGPEVVYAAVKVIEKTGVQIVWEEVHAGMDAIAMFSNPLPNETIHSIQKNKIALKGPLTTPVGSGFRSINVALRKEFDLYVNLRPAIKFQGIKSNYNNVDLVIVRENTEGLYSGIEHYIGQNREAAESVVIVTKSGSERIARFAFEYAKQNGRKKVTIVHKANILKFSSGLFLDTTRQIALEYPEIQCEDKIIDNMCMQLVTDPTKFDVIVTTNMFGDIISDLTAGLIGGLGVAPGANIGKDGIGIFEAVHGSAPDIIGMGIANPLSVMLSSCLMLDYIGEKDASLKIMNAIRETLKNPVNLTKDLGGSASTNEITNAILSNL
ncbi:isocitrate/isopropylmalate dehydrogenase family protein [bacterium]|nr:isocitrate/isopropylmalate dehydrogenase family protein [bacterium]